MRLFQNSSCLIVSALVCLHAVAQDSDPKAGRISPKELTIPASPVFDLMGVTPSQVNRTTDIKDFKVDWSFKSWKLNPNLAIESQPVWEIFYNRKELSKYQHASSFMRRMASVDVSIGSVQNEDNDRRIGVAGKINLYKQKDPLLAKELYEDISVKYKKEKVELETQIIELQHRLDTTQDILQKPGLRLQIKSTEDQLLSINARRNEEINSRAKIFVSENWNASSLDVAAGSVYTYKTDSSGSLTSLQLNRNTGWGMWLNGGIGIGKKMLLSGLARVTWYREQLNFNVIDKATGESSSQQAVADNNLYSVGLNLRYGGSIYNFFIEFFYEKKGLKTPMEALNEVFTTPDNSVIPPSSVKWSVVHPNTVSLGGDWRIGRNVMLNYGMRFVYDVHWKLQTFIPVATVSCMMR